MNEVKISFRLLLLLLLLLLLKKSYVSLYILEKQ